MDIKKKLLGLAEFLRADVPGLNMYSSGLSKDILGKFQFDKDWYKLVKFAMQFYRTDPIVSNTLNKFVDIAMKGYYLARGNCTDEEYLVYSSVNQLMLENLQDLALEFYLSGLLVPEVTWHSTSDIHPDVSGSYIVPETLWKRNPLSLELKKTPMPNRVNVYTVPSEEDIYFIVEKGEYSDGTKDKETYELLKQEYPEYVAAIQRGETKFKLEDPHLIRRKPLDDSPYPTPYLLAAFEPLEHKRNLRKMDYAIAARVITAILLFRLGNDEFPLTEDDGDQVIALKAQLNWRGSSKEPERLFQLFANHTLQADWITPDTAALLDDKKYAAANLDIILAMGIPRIVLTGEAERSGSGNPEFALMSIAESLDALRALLITWPNRVYKELRDRNGFINLPTPTFEAIRLADLAKIIEIADLLYQRGAIAKSTLARLGGFDYESTELPMREYEQKLIDASGLTEFPLMPFTANPDGENNDPSKPNEGNNGQTE